MPATVFTGFGYRSRTTTFAASSVCSRSRYAIASPRRVFRAARTPLEYTVCEGYMCSGGRDTDPYVRITKTDDRRFVESTAGPRYDTRG